MLGVRLWGEGVYRKYLDVMENHLVHFKHCTSNVFFVDQFNSKWELGSVE